MSIASGFSLLTQKLFVIYFFSICHLGIFLLYSISVMVEMPYDGNLILVTGFSLLRKSVP